MRGLCGADCPTQEEYSSLREEYISEGQVSTLIWARALIDYLQGFIVVYSIVDNASFDAVSHFVSKIRQVRGFKV